MMSIFSFCWLWLLAVGQGIDQSPETIESRHLSNIKQLTYGGDNAEAYFSPDGRHVSTQITNPKWGLHCDQIFDIDIAHAAADSTYRPPMVSTGLGRTTCSYFMPDGLHILYASTHLGADSCPPVPAPRADHKYVWPIYSDFDIFVADGQGKITKRLTQTKGYDAEATISPNGKKIVFTSIRSGDLELYTMDINGSHVKQITRGLGYDGGAFFSPDSKELVFRASRPTTPEQIKTYKQLLTEGLVMPTEMELYTCHADGSGLKQVTHLGKANWAPFFTHDGKRIVFASNHASKRGYDFNLYTIGIDGSGLEQITSQSVFNAFPMFSPDGKKLIWSSNRNNHGTHDTNLFIADWKD
jgi:TolB protein